MNDQNRAGSVTHSTCGLKGIQLGWHQGCSWAQISCSGHWRSSTLSKGWKLLFWITSKYLLVLITGLSFSRILFWHSAMMYLLPSITFSRYSHRDFILQKHSVRIPSGVSSVQFWFFVSQHGSTWFFVCQHGFCKPTLSVNARLAWTALFRRMLSQLHSFTSAKSTGRAICNYKSTCRQTFGLHSSNRSPLPWIHLTLFSLE